MTSNVRPALGSVRKAAVLLDTLPPLESAELLSLLQANEAEAVSLEMERIDAIDPRERKGVMLEFVADGLKARRRRPAFPKILYSTTATADEPVDWSIFEFLEDYSREELLACLRAEHPQTVALVVSRLRDPLAAAIVAGLPPDVAPNVLRRIGRLSPCNGDVLDDVAQGLRETLSRPRMESPNSPVASSRSGSLDHAI